MAGTNGKNATRIGTAAALTALALLTAACGTNNTASSGSNGSIVVGLATPLTGGDPSEGKSEQAIAQDAVADINKAGGVNGHQLQLVVRDTGGVSPTGAVSAFESLTSAGAKVVLGEWTSTNFQAACSIAMAEHVVLIGHASATDGLTNGKTYCFRDEYQVSQSSGAMFATAKSMGWDKIAIASDTTSFGAGESDSWKALASKYGVSIADDVTWNSPASTLTAQVSRLANSGAKAVFVGSGSGPDTTLLAKTMAQLNVKLPIFGPGGINASGVPEAAGSAYSSLPLVLNITSYDSSVAKEAAFMDQIGKETGIAQGGGNPTRLWDAFHIAAEGLKKSNGSGGQSLVDGLQSAGKITTLAGGPGSYVQYSATQHSGLFGPQMLSIYKWDSATKAFVHDADLSKAADSSPGVNG